MLSDEASEGKRGTEAAFRVTCQTDTLIGQMTKNDPTVSGLCSPLGIGQRNISPFHLQLSDFIILNESTSSV